MYFHPKKPTPKMLQHIEDVDLWKFKLKGTREISAQLELIPAHFKEWSVFAKNLEDVKKRAQIIAGGKLLLTYKRTLVERMARNAQAATFAGKKVLVLNSPEFQSELGHVLAERSGIGVIWYNVGNVVRVSLRSDGAVDVAKIAERYGGGGHKAAAGFLIKKGEFFPWKTKK
jgi:oligoribonuclease NrnB/cAMP/cGMP phosphodiesterase (DHH superfamily)